MKRLLPLLLVLLAGCTRHPPPDAAAGFPSAPVRLDGTYGIVSGAVLAPVLKVEKTAAGYSFTERMHDEWGADPETPHTATPAEVARALGPVEVPVFGLSTRRATLLKVPANWASANVVSRSGFVLLFDGQLHPTEKVELGSR